MTSYQHRPSIRIIYEDNHLLVVEKPVNVPSQGDESNDPDMLTLLKEDIKIRFNKPGDVFLGLVHRLDRPAGGVMVFARTSKAASRLSDQIRRREFIKLYMTVVHGTPANMQGQLKHYLIKDTATNIVKAVPSQAADSMEAILDYEVIAQSSGLSLVRVNLHTGRPHQIRVQLSTIGHPLYGDQKYGSGINKPGQQMALWSTQITLMHPTRQEEMTFKCSPPNTLPWSGF